MNLMDKKSKPASSFAVLLSLLVMGAAIVAVFFLFLPKQGQDYAAGGSIELSIAGGTRLLENQAATAKADSTCGSFSLFLDGKKISDAQRSLQFQISAPAGTHLLSAKSQGCERQLQFSVVAAECSGNQTRSCVLDGCEGGQQCSGGLFSGCALPKKICVPGRQIGCNLNGCSFGRMACNSCGTGYGPCTADGNSTAGASCNVSSKDCT